jgi:hypothetical protein
MPSTAALEKGFSVANNVFIVHIFFVGELQRYGINQELRI